MTSHPYLIADDLSGALEAGAAFLNRGLAVTAPLADTGDAEADVQVWSTDTRELSDRAAARIVRRVLEQQQAAGARLLFKKMDSTLRGPYAAEVKVLRDVLSPPLIVVCPANPKAGRCVREGVLYVDDVPVAETSYWKNSSRPLADSHVATSLARAKVGPIRHLPLAQLRSGGRLTAAQQRGVLVSDAETAADLTRLVTCVRREVPAAVFVGAGGLAHALASTRRGRKAALRWPRCDSTLIVCGSPRERSRWQIERLRDALDIPIHELRPGGPAPAHVAAEISRALRSRGVSILGIDGSRRWPRPRAASERLGAVVAALYARPGAPKLLAATGGETALILCLSLGVRELSLRAEFEPGVVLAIPHGDVPAALKWVLVKPGGFGTPGLWLKLVSH